VVSWQIDGNTCDVAGVKSVHISLTLEEALYDTAEKPCADGEAAFIDLPPGDYQVALEGRNDKGEVKYVADSVTVEVPPGATGKSPKMVLSPIGSGLNLTWYFQDNKLCSFAGVVQVEVNVWSKEGQALGDSPKQYACDPFQEAGATGDATPGIKILNLQVKEVDLVLFGLDQDGDRVYKGTASVKLEDGKLLDVQVELKPCSGTCT
jgi:hypothetical protein